MGKCGLQSKSNLVGMEVGNWLFNCEKQVILVPWELVPKRTPHSSFPTTAASHGLASMVRREGLSLPKERCSKNQWPGIMIGCPQNLIQSLWFDALQRDQMLSLRWEEAGKHFFWTRRCQWWWVRDRPKMLNDCMAFSHPDKQER